MPEDTFAGLDPSTGPSFFLFGLSVPLLPRARPHDEASELVEWKSSPPIFVDRFDARLLLDPLDTTEGIGFIPYSAASPSNDISASRATHDAGIGGEIVESEEQGIPSRETSKGEGEAAPYNEAFERELDRERYRDLDGDAEWSGEEGVMPDTEEGEGVGLEGNGVGWTMSRDRGGAGRGGAAVPPWYGTSNEIGVMMAVPVGLHGLFPLPPPKRTMDPENESRDGPLSPMHRAVMDRVAEFVARHGNESARWVQTRAALDPIFAFTLPTHRHYELFWGLVSRCRERILPGDPWRTDAYDLNVTGGEWNGNKDSSDDLPEKIHPADEHAEQGPENGVSAEEEGLAGLLSIYNDDDGGSSDPKDPSSESPGRGQDDDDDDARSPTMEYQESNGKRPAQSACYDPKGSGSGTEKESSEAVRDHRPLDLREVQDDSTIHHVKERLVASLKRGGYAFAKLLKQKMVTAEAFELDFLRQSLEAAKAKASRSTSEEEAVVVPAEQKCDRKGSNVCADLEKAIRIATEHARRLSERTRGKCLQAKRVDIACKALLQDLSIEQIDDPFFEEIARILLEEGTGEAAKDGIDASSVPEHAAIDGNQHGVEIGVEAKSDASGEGDAAVVREGRDVPRQPDIPPIPHLDKPEKKSGIELDGIESSFDLDTTVDDFRKAARLRKARRAVQAHRDADAAQKRSKRLLESMRDDEERRKKQAAISAHKRLLLGDDDE